MSGKSFGIATVIALSGLITSLLLNPIPADAAPQNVVVNCNRPNASNQDDVDSAVGPTVIRINGHCVEDVSIAKGDVTLSGHASNVEGIEAQRQAFR